ncbi:phage portal protein [Nocardiopsis dassonvillei]
MIVVPEDRRLHRGLERLEAAREDLELLDRHYRGDQDQPYVPRKAKAEYKRLAENATSAWLRLVVEAIAERMRLEGIRGRGDQAGDLEAWRILEANRMMAVQSQIYTECLKLGKAFVSVWPNATDPSTPVIRGESPLRVYVEREALDFTPVWAVKKIAAETPDGQTIERSFLYDAREVVRYTRTHGSGQWQEEGRIPNPLRRVPFVEFPNDPDLLGETASEIAPLLPIQHRINSTNLNMQLAMIYSAYRQRWATGMAIPEDDDGNPVEPFNAAVDRLWIGESPDIRFGEFSESNLANYVTVLDSLVRQLAAISQVPPHYLLGQLVNLSGDAIKAAEAGLVSKVQGKLLVAGEAWSRVLDLVAVAGGRVQTPCEPVWADPSTRTEGQIVDALTKLGAPPIAIPQEALWERYGASPATIARWKRMQADASQRASAAQTSGALFGAQLPEPDDAEVVPLDEAA